MNHRRLVIGNWKENPATLAEARAIARKVRRASGGLKRTDVIIAPPAVFIQVCSSRRHPDLAAVGAQSASAEPAGAHTGEISAAMLKSLGVRHVLAGHSETRISPERPSGDTDGLVAGRVRAILGAGLKAVLCVGEKARDEGGAYLEELKEQIKGSLAGVGAKHARNIILAYEPVWAIGASQAMAADEICQTALFARKVFADVFGPEPALKVPVLYGGSVTVRNAAEIVRVGRVDGLLVGRESVNTAGFIELLKAVDSIRE